MIDAIKKAMLAGVGAAAITREKAEKALNDLVDKGKISASEAREAADKLAEDGKKEFEDASKNLENRLNDTLSRLGKGHEERIKKLETSINALNKRIVKLEKSASAADQD